MGRPSKIFMKRSDRYLTFRRENKGTSKSTVEHSLQFEQNDLVKN